MAITYSRPLRDGSRVPLTGRGSVKMGLDTSGLDQYLDALAEEAQAAVRPAAQAAAQVLYERVQLNVSMLGRKSGNLANSIYQVFSQERSTDGKAVYSVSWNHKKAPHGHLVEYGYLQRYRYYQDAQGNVRPMVRAGMEGQPRPGRRATQAAKNAYYVTLDTPRQVPGKAFVRSAQSSMDEAYKAAEAELLRRILQKS